MKIVLVFTSLLTFIVTTQAQSLNVSLYYESLCPDSKRFITNQLYFGYQLLEDHLNLDFLPYGNADITTSSDGTLNFTCQHGPNECYGNEIQACAISLKPESALVFVHCAMSSDDASDDENLKLCAEYTGIEWDDIEECMTSGLAEELFVQYGERTEAMNITYVPTIVFDGVYNQTLQDQAEFNFIGTVCQLLDYKPAICHTIPHKV